ncbi:hypothetical protein THAOC_08726, partial [Thalassiosira oceanica]
TIGCENEESFNGCFYQEESFDGSVSLDVCYPFDIAEALSIDGNTCMLGFVNGGILLKESADALDPSCEPKYVLKMTTEIGKESSDELLLYFSNDGGESFYNEDDPRVATRASDDEIHSRRAEVCIASSNSLKLCIQYGEVCNAAISCGGNDCCRNSCCSGYNDYVSAANKISDNRGTYDSYCTCIPSGIRCGYEKEASIFASGVDTGCVQHSQEWVFPVVHLGATPIGEGKYDKCCSGMRWKEGSAMEQMQMSVGKALCSS